MNRKSIFSCVALVLAAACFTSCVNSNQKVIFSRNWQKDNTHFQSGLTEELVYDITFEKSSINGSYSLDYQNGTYTTKLTTEQVNGKIIYCYETKLEIDVLYECGQNSDTFQDVVYSWVKFEDVDKALRPIASHKEIISHSPSNSASSLEECYYSLNYVVDITYNEDYSGNTVITMLNAEEPTEYQYSFQMKTDKLTGLDNEEILFALRGVNPSLSQTAKFTVYSPFVDNLQTVKATFGTESSIDFSFRQNGELTKDTIQYYPVDVVLDEKNPGNTQKLWIAKNTNSILNKYHNVILKMEMPVYYNLGTLVYTLTSATFSN